MEQGEELRNDSFHLIGDEHLVTIQLNLVALDVDIVLDAWEIKNTCEVEGIVNIQMNPEQRFIHLHGVEGAIEQLVLFFFQCTRRFGPQRFHIVDDMILFCLYLFTVLPFRLLSESDGHRKELAILVQQLFDLTLLQELLAVVIDIENDITTAVFLFSILNGKLRTAVATPFHGFCTILITLGDNLYFL